MGLGLVGALPLISLLLNLNFPPIAGPPVFPNLLLFCGAPICTHARLPLAGPMLYLWLWCSALSWLLCGTLVTPFPLSCPLPTSATGAAPSKSALPFWATLLRNGVSPSVHSSEVFFLVAISYSPITSFSNSNKNKSQVKLCLIHTFLNTNLLAYRPD